MRALGNNLLLKPLTDGAEEDIRFVVLEATESFSVGDIVVVRDTSMSSSISRERQRLLLMDSSNLFETPVGNVGAIVGHVDESTRPA